MPNGIFIAVVGPSGAGKDTLLTRAAGALADRDDVRIVRRVITRLSDGTTEDHDTLNADDFEQARKRGAFCVDWGAHGLLYGLPASALDAVRSGHAVVANVSRDVLEHCLATFGRLAVIEITVDGPMLQQRLAARGRESATDTDLRIKRSKVVTVPPGAIHVRVDNSGSVDTSAERFIAELSSLARS